MMRREMIENQQDFLIFKFFWRGLRGFSEGEGGKNTKTNGTRAVRGETQRLCGCFFLSACTEARCS